MTWPQNRGLNVKAIIAVMSLFMKEFLPIPGESPLVATVAETILTWRQENPWKGSNGGPGLYPGVRPEVNQTEARNCGKSAQILCVELETNCFWYFESRDRRAARSGPGDLAPNGTGAAADSHVMIKL